MPSINSIERRKNEEEDGAPTQSRSRSFVQLSDIVLHSDSVRRLLKSGKHFVLHFAVSSLSWELTSVFLPLSFYSPFPRLLEVDNWRSTMTRVYVPVLPPIDPPSGPVRVLKQTRRSRCDPFIPIHTSTSYILLRRPPSRRCHVLPALIRTISTYLPTYLLFSTWLDRTFSPFLKHAWANYTHKYFILVKITINLTVSFTHIAPKVFRYISKMFQLKYKTFHKNMFATFLRQFWNSKMSAIFAYEILLKSWRNIIEKICYLFEILLKRYQLVLVLKIIYLNIFDLNIV